jgi:predicted phosphodiesterase
MTKVILLGDCHGQFKKLDDILTQESPFDFFLTTGDVGSISDVTPENIQIVDKWKCGYSIMGNHDQWDGKDIVFFSPLGSLQSICGVAVAAFNGMIKTRTVARNFASLVEMTHLKNVDILVTHQPPPGLFDNMGESVLGAVLQYVKPKIYISGHIHRYKSVYIDGTFLFSLPLVFNGYVVVYFNEHTLKNIEVTYKKGKRVIKI